LAVHDAILRLFTSNLQLWTFHSVYEGMAKVYRRC